MPPAPTHGLRDKIPPQKFQLSATAKQHRISLIISHTFLHETSHPKNGVRLTIEMRLTFGIFVKLTVRHAYAHTVYMKSYMRVSLGLVEGNF